MTEQCHTQKFYLRCFKSDIDIEKSNLIYSLSRLRRRPQNEDDLKNEDNLKNEDDLKNKDDLKNEANLKYDDNLKMIGTSAPQSRFRNKKTLYYNEDDLIWNTAPEPSLYSPSHPFYNS